jgi:hypothetical protein
MPRDHIARAEKAGVMITLVETDSEQCDVVVRLGGQIRARAPVSSKQEGHAVFYRLAVLLDNLSFDLPSEAMFECVMESLSATHTAISED